MPETSFAGLFNFTVGFPREIDPPIKAAPYTYSNPLKKLYAKIDVLVPIQFMFTGTCT